MRILLALLLLVSLVSGVQSQGTVDSFEGQVVNLSNEVRQRNGLPSLVANPYLSRAARSHSEEMARLNFFDHESPTLARRFPWDRVNQAGADADAISENIYLAEGYPLPEVPAMAVHSWEVSPQHRHNLLDPAVTSIGVGIAQVGGQIYVTQVFASPVAALRQ